MRTPDYTKQFQRDFKKALARGKDGAKFEKVAGLLLEGLTLPATYQDHPLKGDWVNYRELHIEFDWLLVYKITDNVVLFTRTGSHDDIFG